MDTRTLTHVPVAHTGMLIRRPAADVFEALVDPAITSKFWFTNGSGRLETGKRVRWDWKMYDVSADVLAKAIEPNERIEIEWPSYSGHTTVEWRLDSLQDDATFIDEFIRKQNDEGAELANDQLLNAVRVAQGIWGTPEERALIVEHLLRPLNEG